MYKLSIGGSTHVGKKRKVNQDYFEYFIPCNSKEQKKGTLIVLADGMGGYSGGEIASKMAVKQMLESYYSDKNKNVFKSINLGFNIANNAIIQKSHDDPTLKGMGTTMIAIAIKKNKLYCAHVGDSRAYLVSKSGLTQLTQDHSYIASLISKGLITEEEAETHPDRNMITRAVGVKKDLEVDFIKKRIRPKISPYLLICCDGLYREVDNKTIANTIFSLKNPQTICDQLISLANDNGGSDNITVIVAQFKNVSLYRRLFP